MTLKDLTERQAVLQAIQEYDELGQQAFLEKYGFGTARRYMLVHNDRHYDSKAIAGVAHLIQTGALLRRNEFTGGVYGAVRTLEALGFDVDDADAPMADSDMKGAVELLWNPKEQPWDDLIRYQTAITACGTASGRWSVGQTKTGIQRGDRLFLFLVGGNRRGLVGSGHAASEIFTAPHWNGEESQLATYINVVWDALVDPDNLMAWADITTAIPTFPPMFRVSGRRIDGEQSSDLEELWQEHLDAPAGKGPQPAPDEVQTGYGYGMVQRRTHQSAFRALLFRHYDPVCHVCGLDQIEILEAAHVIPDSTGGPSSVENGRLLCPNHHRAHDAGLFHFESGTAVWSEQTKDALIPRG